jgi:hypothetical protein
VRGVLEGDEVRQILRESFFTSIPAPPPGPSDLGAAALPEREPEPAGRRPRSARRACNKPRPDHYKVICISMYNEDLERLDAIVRELKRRGFTKANRSAVLRVAMEHLQIDRVRKGL